MKRAASLLLSAALLLGLLSACQGNPAPSAATAQDWTVSELANIAFDHCGRDDRDGLEGINAEMDREWMAAYIENAYGLQEPWEDAAVIRAAGASAFEIAVLQMEDSESAVHAATALMSYIFSRQGDFAGYAPAEADMVANGSIMQDGVFSAVFICPAPDSAREVVEAALNGEYIPNQPGPAQGAVDDVNELRDLLVTSQGMDGADLERLDDGNLDALNAYMRDPYGLTPDQWQECAIARGTGESAFEVAVIRAADWNMAGDVEMRLNDYLDSREAAFSGSDQFDMLYQARVIASEPYIVLLACKDTEGAGMTFAREAGTGGYGGSLRHRFPAEDPDYSGRCKFTAPNKDDMSLYDTSAILDAWEKNDPAGLSGYDRKIYDQAKKVLDKVLKDGMSDYEKEVAIYSWMVKNINYDWTHQNRMKETPRESFEPYGGLVNHKAVCLGYATTFQLLMDLAVVECITVPGAAFSSLEDHGWNMVRLNGEWYCVDVTWDANQREQLGRGKPEEWEYFNVTSNYMADTDHQWDYANTPEATATDHGQG